MIWFEQFALEITACKATHPEQVERFGRTINFQKGLNVIVGDNTAGKTTLSKCLCFAIGMEQLYSNSTGIEGLDKSVKDEFVIECSELEGQWKVIDSHVTCILVNSNEKKILLKRTIKSQEGESNRIANIISISEIEEGKPQQPKRFFLHERGDHNRQLPNAFYAYLADFAELDLVDTTDRKGNPVQIYLQSIFALSYIEQKKGWSDYFANIPSFNMVQAKNRIVEYALGLNQDTAASVNKTKKEQMKELENELASTISLYCRELAVNNMQLSTLDIGSLSKGLDTSSMHLMMINDAIDVETYKKRLLARQEQIKETELEAQGNEPEKLRKAKQELQENINKYNKYLARTSSDGMVLNQMQNQKKKLESKRLQLNSLLKFCDIIDVTELHECPTCHQPITVTMRNQHAHFDKTNLEREVQSIDTEIKFLKGMIAPLAEKLERSKSYLAYFEKLISQEREICNKMVDEMSQQTSISKGDVYELAKISLEIDQIKVIEQRFCNVVDNLLNLEERYNTIRDSLRQTEQDDNRSALTNSLIQFREYLRVFGYESHNYLQAHFDENNTAYKYMPIVAEENGYIKISLRSSASDFIRSVWAYYLSLLKNAFPHRHPGFLIMDEPAQHSMRPKDLKKLFSECADMTERQTILFSSSQPSIFEDTDSDSKSSATANRAYVVDELINQLMNEKQINKISIRQRAVDVI